MHECYQRTALTPIRVARSSGYIDWAMQPAPFKRYPDGLFSYTISEHEVLKPVALARCVTSRQQIGGRPYLRLNTPSAGNLHPLELYVQIRAVEGIVSGIYHVDPARDRIVLIREVERDGLEADVGLPGRVGGMLFVLSCVPFRSAWKYGDRAERYCLLDAGHQLGALQAAAACTGESLTLLSGFDAERLGWSMGFDLQEQALCAAYCGNVGPRACEPIMRPLMRVFPTDYCEGDEREWELLRAGVPGLSADAAPYREIAGLEEVILSRRSSRRFLPEPLPESARERLMQWVFQSPQPFVCHIVVLRGSAPEPGLYQAGRAVRRGLFTDTLTALLLDQAMVAASDMAVILTAPRFSAQALIAAGTFAHALQLHSCAHGLGLSPVGAFYDRKLQYFLETDDYILYALVIGNDPLLRGGAKESR